MSESDEVTLHIIDVQRRLSGYIYSLVLDHELTKDLLQRTNVVLLKKRDTFEPGTNFFAWACRVAYHEVLAARRDRLRERHVFDEDLLSTLAVQSEQLFAQQDARMEALFNCLASLRQDHQRIILARYRPGGSVSEISATLQKTPAAVSSLLNRIRNKLMDCVERKLKGRPST